MELFRKIITNTVFTVQILIAFILIFEKSILVPAWLQAFGRLHPLLLHLPIGFLLLTTLLIFVRRIFESPTFHDLVIFLLHLTALTASLSAFMGLILSHEGGYTETDMFLHKWLGVSLSFLCWFLLTVKENPKILRPFMAIGVVLLIFTGHFGANLTHGENFVLGPLQLPEIRSRVITDSTTLFSAAIEPILETKCFSCHNEQKAKGKLVLTSLENILKGGEDGEIWKPGDPDHSLIIERLNLPLESKEHMPPKDKAQLTVDEIDFISQWIEKGADTKSKLIEIPANDSLRISAAPIISRYHQPAEHEPKYHFAFASQDRVNALSTPYRTVFQIARNEPALQADFYLSGSFQKKYLEELNVVKQQVVSLNLSKMPLTDDDLKMLAQFTNLEKLVLNNTSITGDGLIYLQKLPNLRILSLSGTKTIVEKLKLLASNKSLREVYVWNTGVTTEEIKSLQQQFKDIRWDIGYQPDPNEMLRLSPPLVQNDGQVLRTDEPVALKHNLPGAIIRYTLDGNDPDSISSTIYKDPIPLDGYSILKTKAYKEGWITSKAAEFVFFKKGYIPSSGELLTEPEKRYEGEGVLTLINEKKGLPDFYRDPVWMAFREEPLEAFFFFSGDIPSVNSITLSYARNISARCMPPETMEVWGGSDPKHLKLLNKIKPTQPDSYVSTRIEGVTVEIPTSNFTCYKVVAKPLAKLPDFHKSKKDKGMIMTDEIFFN